MGSVTGPHYVVDVEVVEQLERELTAAQRDAARYRWLRKIGNEQAVNLIIGSREQALDFYIDAAIANKGVV